MKLCERLKTCFVYLIEAQYFFSDASLFFGEFFKLHVSEK